MIPVSPLNYAPSCATGCATKACGNVRVPLWRVSIVHMPLWRVSIVLMQLWSASIVHMQLESSNCVKMMWSSNCVKNMCGNVHTQLWRAIWCSWAWWACRTPPVRKSRMPSLRCVQLCVLCMLCVRAACLQQAALLFLRRVLRCCLGCALMLL